MELGYDEGIVVTNDYYKVRVGGLSKNSFLLIRPGSLNDLIEPEGDEEAVSSGDLRGEGGANPGDLFDLLSRPRAQRPTSARPFRHIPPYLVLVRVLEPAATPISQEAARVYFELRKSQVPESDP